MVKAHSTFGFDFDILDSEEFVDLVDEGLADNGHYSDDLIISAIPTLIESAFNWADSFALEAPNDDGNITEKVVKSVFGKDKSYVYKSIYDIVEDRILELGHRELNYDRRRLYTREYSQKIADQHLAVEEAAVANFASEAYKLVNKEIHAILQARTS